MRMNPLREHMVDDGLAGRPHDQRLLEQLAAAMGDDRDLGREAFDVLRFLLQKALRDEEREVRIARAGLLDAPIELVAQQLPDAEAVGTKHHRAAHRRIIRQLGAQDDVVVPSREILAARDNFFFVWFFCGHQLARPMRIVRGFSLRILSTGINVQATGDT